AVPPLRWHKCPDGGGQVWQYGLERVPGVRCAVQEDDGKAARIALVDVGEADSGAEIDGVFGTTGNRCSVRHHVFPRMKCCRSIRSWQAPEESRGARQS